MISVRGMSPAGQGEISLGQQWVARLEQAQDVILETFERLDIEVTEIEGDLLAVRSSENITQAIKEANLGLEKYNYRLKISDASPKAGLTGLELEPLS